MSDRSLAHLLSPLKALQSLIDRFDFDGIIIGGVALSILAYPRFTADVDAMLLLPVERIDELLAAAEEYGCRPRIGDVKSFARKHRVVLLLQEGNLPMLFPCCRDSVQIFVPGSDNNATPSAFPGSISNPRFTQLPVGVYISAGGQGS